MVGQRKIIYLANNLTSCHGEITWLSFIFLFFFGNDGVEE